MNLVKVESGPAAVTGYIFHLFATGYNTWEGVENGRSGSQNTCLSELSALFRGINDKIDARKKGCPGSSYY